MPGLVRPVSDERDALLAYLAQMRLVLRITAHGLSDAQARSTPLRGGLSVGGLIKHVSSVEQTWMDMVEQRPRDKAADYSDGFRHREDQTLEDVLALYDEAAARTDRVVGGRGLDDAVPVPQGVPWFPQDVEAWSVRWVLLHLIQETARHAGHADLLREEVDGATAFPLMAAVEGWPATAWLQPWTPSGST
ncbi:MAG: DinB family protein [Mycobacteriales bacterium]